MAQPPCYSVTGNCVNHAACNRADGCMYTPRKGNILNNPSNCSGCGKPARMTGKRVQERSVLVCDFCGHVHPLPSIKPMKEIVMKDNGDSYTVNIVGSNIGSVSVGGGVALRVYKNPNFNQFSQQCAKAGYKVEHYEGRSFYAGPAVRVEDNEERLAVIRATTVPLQWDNMGKSGYVVYPMV